MLINQITATGRSAAAPISSSTDFAQIWEYENFSSYNDGDLVKGLITGYKNWPVEYPGGPDTGSTISNEQSYSGGLSAKLLSGNTGESGQSMGFGYHFSDVGLPDIVDGDEVWVRYRIYFDTGSDLSSSPHLKFIRWRTETSSVDTTNQGSADIYYDHNESGGYGIWKWIKEVTPNTWASLGNVASGDPEDIDIATWTAWEMNVKFDSGTDGHVRFWKNGSLVGELTGIQTLSAAGHICPQVNSVFTWNGDIPVEQTWYYDSFALAVDTTARTDSNYLSTDENGNKCIGTGDG